MGSDDANPDLTTAIEQAIDVLAKFSVPLYQNDRDGRPSLHGTGFFVNARSACFLVSAAHVLDTAKEKGLSFYATPNKLRHLSGRLVRSEGAENRSEDLIDVGVLQLSKDSVPPYPEVEKYAMDLSYLRPNTALARERRTFSLDIQQPRARLTPHRAKSQ